MKRFAAVLTALVVFSVPGMAGAQALPGPLAQLQYALRSASRHAPGRVALAVEDLSTGYTSAVNANAVMPAASTIKVPVMVEVFRQMAAGRFDLNRQVELRASDRDWGSGDIADAPVGETFPISTLLTQMITVSDNTAANMLIRLVGRSNINATMKSLGLRHTHLADYIHTEQWGVRSDLRTSAGDMVRLLSKMAKDRLIDEWSSKQMIAILEEQEINTLIPEPLPQVPIAHKTGSFDDTLNDVGIVYAMNEPYVIAVMTTNLPSLGAGRQFIHRVSRLTYSDLERFARWRDANGLDQPLQTDASAATPAQDAPDATPAPAPEDVPMWGTSPSPTATPTPLP
jgi:beta-lactamase class A